MLAEISTGEKIDWLLLWMKIGWVDIVFLILFTVGVFIGLNKGLGKILPRFIDIVVAQTVALEFFQTFAEFVNAKIPIPITLLEIIMFAGLGITSIVAVEFCFQLLTLIAAVEFKSLFKNVAGAILGGITGVLFLSVISWFVLLFPIPAIHESYTNKSLSGNYLIDLTPNVHRSLSRFIPLQWRVTQEED